MSWNLLKSHIEATFPVNPIKFTSRTDSSSVTIPDIIDKSIPDFINGNYFYVNPLLSSGHLQTAYTALNKFESVDHVHYKRRILTVESDKKTYELDGATLKYDRWEGKSTFAIDYVVPKGTDPDHENFKHPSQIKDLPPRTEYLDPAKEHEILDNDKPLVIALHGLSGGLYESYIRAFLANITTEEYGFDGLVLNARGCANHTITSPQLFNGLWTNDLRYLINEHIKPNWPNKRIYLIGFSLGGAITANYAAQEGDSIWPQIKATAIMGTPWDFTDSSHHVRYTSLGHYVYSPTMAQSLLKLLNEHYDTHLKDDVYIEEFKSNPQDFKIELLRDFDDLITSRIFGFNNADEYYRLALPIQRLNKVRVPTLIVSSKDDPITGSRSFPYSEVKINPYTSLIVTSIGGHLGWFKFNGGRWYTNPVSKFFAELDGYDVDRESIGKGDLPRDISTVWNHDRIVT